MSAARTFILATLVTALAWGAETPPALPAAVTRDIDDYRAKVDKITAEAEKKKADEFAKFSKVLDEHIKNETKKGNLEVALAIRNLKTELGRSRAPTEADLLGEPAAAPAAAPVESALIVGTWKMDNGQTWVVKPDGVFTRVREDGAERSGTWRAAEGRIVFVYDSGRECPLARVDRMRLVVLRDDKEMIGERQGK